MIIFGALFPVGSYFIGLSEWYFLVLAALLGLLVPFILIFFLAVIGNQFTSRKKIIIKPKGFYKFLIYLFCDFLVILFRIKVITEGMELIKDLAGYEYISNHQSMLDPVIAINKTKRKDLSFVMKKEIMKTGFIGRFIYNGGSLPLDRDNPRAGLAMIINGAKAIQAGRPIGVYIEGTRSKGPNIGEFHDGSLKMAYKNQSPIVVAVTDNTYNIHKRFPFRRTKVLLKIVKVFNYDEYKDLSTIELGALIKELMNDALLDARNRLNNYK